MGVALREALLRPKYISRWRVPIMSIAIKSCLASFSMGQSLQSDCSGPLRQRLCCDADFFVAHAI